ncbi:uncharacterized protein ASCRUDRAFT_73708 [Ascoidea rubescens DSM 1968]|uniref:Uncharacterized protein n=1 Tax=Ascoidea rubescens DSM 1968 TaxID=1344418 RepID=A0A1D2VQU1_9ASCO|nr:hypothetical protein ASCRUDRAFT_73708 [Ascoidea rubescens DSM 1968]ODV63983.1 hypothetical protein ASCRUDRAFT_73708 [Ascoidea rubescens DSM 1968]
MKRVATENKPHSCSPISVLRSKYLLKTLPPSVSPNVYVTRLAPPNCALIPPKLALKKTDQ